jgi:tripartite-type tricarboxylate transporter receptor subunit TctC
MGVGMFSTVFQALRGVFVTAGLVFVTGLQAQATEFKTVTLKVGYGAGGNYDLTSRLVARHLGRFLPGNPAVVVQNVPGGGSLKLTKMMLGSEPADGSVIASVSEAMPFAPVLDPANADFDPLSMQWIGSLSKEPSICITTKSSGIDTMDKFLQSEFLLGASGKSSLTYILSAMVKNGLGAKFGIVTGFDGIAEITVAGQRGEVAGVCALVYHNVSDQLDAFNVIGRFGSGTIAAAPTLPRFSDQIKDSVTHQAAVLIESSRNFHLPLMAPPGTPKEALDTLRKAYVDMSKDPEFLADAAKLGDLTINITTGEEISKFVAEQLKADPAVFEAARNLAK